MYLERTSAIKLTDEVSGDRYVPLDQFSFGFTSMDKRIKNGGGVGGRFRIQTVSYISM